MTLPKLTLIFLITFTGLARAVSDEIPLTITPVCNSNIVCDHGPLDIWFSVQNNTDGVIPEFSYEFIYTYSANTVKKSGIVSDLKKGARKSFNFFWQPSEEKILPGTLLLNLSWNKVTFTRTVTILRPFSDLSGCTVKAGKLMSPEGNRAIILVPHFDWKKKRSWQLLRWARRKLSKSAIKPDICFIAPRLTNTPSQESYLDIIRESLGGVNFKTVTPKIGETSLIGPYLRSQKAINAPSFHTFFIMPNPDIYSTRFSTRKLYHNLSLLIQHIQRISGRKIFLISPPPHSSAMVIAEQYKSVFEKVSREFEVRLIDILTVFRAKSALAHYYRHRNRKDPLFYTYPVIQGHRKIAEIILHKTKSSEKK